MNCFHIGIEIKPQSHMSYDMHFVNNSSRKNKACDVLILPQLCMNK